MPLLKYLTMLSPSRGWHFSAASPKLCSKAPPKKYSNGVSIFGILPTKITYFSRCRCSWLDRFAGVCTILANNEHGSN